MESLFLLIPISLILVFIIGVLFWWSLRTGQYDDLEGPAYRILLDDRDEPRREKESGENPMGVPGKNEGGRARENEKNL
ncbi:MAG: cbb3-type cytochrome oxidase assembly protein CcoS [Azoarcus sp.]|jgi:cbb3-type cytochrome oxidase maturation protein|nr:cbb3-type cytochrome oxidase assembly protein CcoS [Azoarcus sp.]